MKKRWFVLLCIMTLVITSCGGQTGGAGSESEDSAKPIATNPIPEVKEEVSKDLLQAMADFSAKTGAVMLAGDENVNYSPFSYFTALSMLEPLTSDEARGKLAEGLFLTKHGIKPEDFAHQWAAVVTRDSFRGENGAVEDVANSAWLNERFEYDMTKLDAVSREFGADVFREDFSDADAVKARMAAWITEKTNGFLKEVSPFAEPDTDLALFNTVYFKDQWLNEKQSIGEEEFTQQDGTKVKVPFVESHEMGSRSYFDRPLYQAARFPFSNYASMYLILPKSDLDSLLNEKALGEILRLPIEERKGGEVALTAYFPKFEIDSHFMEMEKALDAVGLGFLTDATNPPLFFRKDGKTASVVEKIIQETRISLDEKGVEAAAYTEIATKEGAMMVEDEVTLSFNKPFLFVLASRSGAPLFVGCMRAFK